MNLFKLGTFQLASGKNSSFKIECESLTEEDWEAIAWVMSGILPPFKVVVGVPRGGVILASKLNYYSTREGVKLLVDDVWTTGKSMNEYREKLEGDWLGAVAFARGPVEDWVTSLFLMAPNYGTKW